MNQSLAEGIMANHEPVGSIELFLKDHTGSIIKDDVWVFEDAISVYIIESTVRWSRVPLVNISYYDVEA